MGDDFALVVIAGNFEMLVEMGRVLNFNVQDTQTIEIDGERVSSTLIRGLLEQANFAMQKNCWEEPFP